MKELLEKLENLPSILSAEEVYGEVVDQVGEEN